MAEQFVILRKVSVWKDESGEHVSYFSNLIVNTAGILSVEVVPVADGQFVMDLRLQDSEVLSVDPVDPYGETFPIGANELEVVRGFQEYLRTGGKELAR